MNLQVNFADGSSKSVLINEANFQDSVHGKQVGCQDCHQGYGNYPHSDKKFVSARDYSLDKVKTCQRCHYSHYSRVLDSVHYRNLQEGNAETASCTDCHGFHDIKKPGNPRSDISKRCEKCHEEIVNTYKSSVHGKALLEEHNEDVPTCTDCHTSHDITSPHKDQFRNTAYTMCGNCHGDTKKMEKYHLSTNVINTYLDDFHGLSNRLYANDHSAKHKTIATCYDCHGVHNIKSTKGASKEDTKKNVLKTCEKCHTGVTPSFADAWLSHYPPTLESAPLVWAVKWIFRILIPLTIVGLVLHILFHLWKIASSGNSRRNK